MFAVSSSEFWPEQQAATVTAEPDILGALEHDNPELPAFIKAQSQPPEQRSDTVINELTAAREEAARLAAELQLARLMADSLRNNHEPSNAEAIAHHILYLVRKPRVDEQYGEAFDFFHTKAHHFSQRIREVQTAGFEPTFDRMAGDSLRRLHAKRPVETTTPTPNDVSDDDWPRAKILTFGPLPHRVEAREQVAKPTTARPVVVALRRTLDFVREATGMNPEDLRQPPHESPAPEAPAYTGDETKLISRFFAARRAGGMLGLWELTTMAFVASGQIIDPVEAEAAVKGWAGDAVLAAESIVHRDRRGKHMAASNRVVRTSRPNLRQFRDSIRQHLPELFTNEEITLTQEG